MVGRFRLPLFALGAVLAFAPAAGATPPSSGATLTADFGAGQLSYVAAPGQLNLVHIEDANSEVRVRDEGVQSVTLTQAGGRGCTQRAPTRLRCPLFARVWVDLGDGDDQAFVRNGTADEVHCGAGTDSVVADPGDSVAADCESVATGDDAPPEPVAPGADDGQGAGDDSPPASGDAPPVDASPAPPAIGVPIGIVLPDAPVRMPAPDTAVVQIGCAVNGSAAPCRGEVSISARVIAPGRHRARRLTIGKRRFRLRRGREVALPVRVHYRGHYTLASRRRRSRARLKVVQRDAAGKVLSVTSRSVTLVAERHRWSRRRRHR